MHKKYIFFSLILFSAYNYTSETRRQENYVRALSLSGSFQQREIGNDGNNFDISNLQQELTRLRQQQETPMHFYSLPSQARHAQTVLATPQEIAQQNAATSNGWFSKARLSVAAMIVRSEVKLPLAETARHGRFPELAQKNIQEFAREFQDEINGLLIKFQENNRKQQQITDESFRIRTENNKQTIRDLNDIFANLPTIEQKFLKHSIMQSTLARSLQDIETNFQRQLEINRATVERTMQESADIAKILNDLQMVKQRFCRPEQSTDLVTLLAETEATLRAMNRNRFQ